MLQLQHLFLTLRCNTKHVGLYLLLTCLAIAVLITTTKYISGFTKSAYVAAPNKVITTMKPSNTIAELELSQIQLFKPAQVINKPFSGDYMLQGVFVAENAIDNQAIIQTAAADAAIYAVGDKLNNDFYIDAIYVDKIVLSNSSQVKHTLLLHPDYNI